MSASGGPPPVASLNEVKAIAEKMEDQSGCIPSQEDAGFVSMDSPEFTSQTKRNCSVLIASQGNI